MIIILLLLFYLDLLGNANFFSLIVSEKAAFCNYFAVFPPRLGIYLLAAIDAALYLELPLYCNLHVDGVRRTACLECSDLNWLKLHSTSDRNHLSKWIAMNPV